MIEETSKIEQPKTNKIYDKLLKNLISIERSEQAIFTNINNIDSFDIYKIFGQNVITKILNDQHFIITNQDIDNNKKQMNSKNGELYRNQKGVDVTGIYRGGARSMVLLSKMSARPSYVEPEIKKNVSSNPHKAPVTRKNGGRNAKSCKEWATFRRKVIDMNIQENIWPLHFATGFVSIRLNSRIIYAPLLLLQVNISINEDNSVQWEPLGTWKFNEKLLLLLNEEGIKINSNRNIKDKNVLEILFEIEKELKHSFNEPFINSEFSKIKKEEIKNKNLEIHSGVVMGLYKSSGGMLRQSLKNIVTRNEVDKILQPEVTKKIYENNVENFIINKSNKIYKIQHSNFSQDCALISSLLQDTIIWGPPGTGKSQVIANIIANILYQNKTAIVMSQKKAALEVLKKRLGNISPFVLFVLNDNKMTISEFYKPLQKLISYIEEIDEIKTTKKNKWISTEEINALKLINKYKIDNSYYSSLNLLNVFQDDYSSLIKIYKLNNNYVYPAFEDFSRPSIYEKEMASLNNIQVHRNFFGKHYDDNFSHIANEAYLLNSKISNQNLNNLLLDTKKTSLETIKKIAKIWENLSPRKEMSSSSVLDQDFLTNVLTNRILKKVNDWKKNNDSNYDLFIQFAEAVRAARRNPTHFMNQHKFIIKELFPILITTPDTPFVNWEKNVFDYAIIDESSQMFVEVGLPILYSAKIRILAGDNQQMQPSNWFSSRKDNDIDEDSAENATSILDYAFDKGVYSLMLNQNFRSTAASLMAFSSKHFYDSNLDVVDHFNLTNSNQVRIEIKNVNGSWEDGCNKREVEEILKILNAEKNKYESIMIVAFNIRQRDLIENHILESYPELVNLIENEKLSLKNIENVQGDEADLVIMSVVYDKTTAIASTYVSREGGQNALNVAISRAKEKIIVVKSINAKNTRVANSSAFKIFKQWLMFLDMSENERRVYSELPPETSVVDKTSFQNQNVDWVNNLFSTISNHGLIKGRFQISKNFKIGNRQLDIVVKNKAKIILCIQLNYYNYSNNNIIKDHLSFKSQCRFLEVKGYPIITVSELEWLVNKENVIRNIISKLRANIKIS